MQPIAARNATAQSRLRVSWSRTQVTKTLGVALIAAAVMMPLAARADLLVDLWNWLLDVLAYGGAINYL